MSFWCAHPLLARPAHSLTIFGIGPILEFGLTDLLTDFGSVMLTL